MNGEHLSCFPRAEKYIPYDVAVFAATSAGNGTEVAETYFTEQRSKSNHVYLIAMFPLREKVSVKLNLT